MTRACRDCGWARLPSAWGKSVYCQRDRTDENGTDVVVDGDMVCASWKAYDDSLNGCEFRCDGYRGHAMEAATGKMPDKCRYRCPKVKP